MRHRRGGFPGLCMRLDGVFDCLELLEQRPVNRGALAEEMEDAGLDQGQAPHHVWPVERELQRQRAAKGMADKMHRRADPVDQRCNCRCVLRKPRPGMSQAGDWP